jgi:nicotinamide mononucleotide (NMN) deamidase PncC
LSADTILTISPDLCDRAKSILDALKDSGHSIVTAESFTAGMIAAVLSRADGAGDVLHGGFVTYTRAALGVSADLLAMTARSTKRSSGNSPGARCAALPLRLV